MRARGHHRSGTRDAGRRLGRAPLLWWAGAAAALVLVLGAGSTLSGWSTATIGNTDNSVRTAGAVILQETSGAVTCLSSASPTNAASCATINKYGGTGTPLAPGGSQTVDVTFTNLGAAVATSFTLVPGSCTSSPSTGTPTPTNLCTAPGELTVSVNCSNGASFVAGSKWADLSYTGVPGAMGTLTHTAALPTNATWTCRFVASLPLTASVLDQGVTVTQPLTWNLNA